MNTKRNTKSTSAKTRKITAEDAALMKRYAEVCAKSRRERAEWDRKHPYRAVCAYVPKAHKVWLERYAEAEGESVSELVARIIKFAYDCNN